MNEQEILSQDNPKVRLVLTRIIQEFKKLYPLSHSPDEVVGYKKALIRFIKEYDAEIG